MRTPRRGEPQPMKPPDDYLAVEDADRLAHQAATALARANEIDWYEENGTPVDEAAFALCRLRRAEAGVRGRPEAGDAAVRRILVSVDAEVLVWLLSRAISYMDESGYPEAVEPWFADARGSG